MCLLIILSQGVSGLRTINKMSNINHCLENIDFTVESVQTVLHNLKITSSANAEAAQHGLPTILFKKTSTALNLPLCLLFQKCLDEGDIPSDWLNLTILPTFTKGDRTDPNTYKAIIPVSVYLRVMEKILSDKIIDHLERNNLLSTNPHGLLSNRSFLNNTKVVLEEHYPVDVIYLDWRNVFVNIPHNHLIAKLKSYDISGKVLKWIEVFIKNRTMKVSVEGVFSTPFSLSSGFPLGSLLGRLLYLIYIDDLFDGIQSSGKLQADDCILFRSIKSSNDRFILHNDLEKVQKWCNKWSIQFNNSKCKVKHIGESNPKYDYYMNKGLIEKYYKEALTILTTYDSQLSAHKIKMTAKSITGEKNKKDMAEKTSFSKLCEITDNIFSKDSKYPILHTDPDMNVMVTDLVSFGDLEDAIRVSTEKIPVGGTIIGTIHTVRHFHPGMYRCTEAKPYEDHEPVLIYHHEDIDPAKIIRQSFLMMKDINGFHRNVINSINRYDWTHKSSWGVVSSEESGDNDELLNKRQKDKKGGKNKELYKKRKRYMYFARYENASYLKKCVKKESIVCSSISPTHFTVTSPQLNSHIAMAAEVKSAMPEQWKLGKAFQDISSQKYFALMINTYAMFMYDIEELGYDIKDLGKKLSNRYPGKQFTSVKETELKFNMTDFKF